MKRTIAIVLVLCLCLGLCACGKSAEAKQVDNLILAIGNVTLEKAAAVIAAKEQFDALTDEQKAEVENFDELEDAIDDLIDAIETAIEQINMEDPNADNALTIAKDAYNALPEDLKETVENKSRLELAEKMTSLLITNFKSVSAQKANLFKEDVNTWYSSLDAAATLHICFWLQVFSSKEVDANDVGIVPHVACYAADNRVETYATYGDNGAIVCFRYWPESGTAQVGTVNTDLSVEEYLKVLKEAGVVDKYQEVPLSNVSKIISLLS